MSDLANASAKRWLLIEQLKLKAAELETIKDLDHLRGVAISVGRLADELLHYIQVEIIEELRSSMPMPQHKFTGRPRVATIDDL